jgi:molecular chaperone GrpE
MIRAENRTTQNPDENTFSSPFLEIISKWRNDYVAKLTEIHTLRYKARTSVVNTDEEIRTFLKSLIETLDSYDKMLNDIQMVLSEEDTKANRVLKSFASLRKQFAGVLQKFNAKPIETGDGKFISGLHKAVGVRYTLDVPEGHVVRVEKQGYYWKSKVLRPAEVVVASSRQDNPEE